ncbi:mannose-6-phosphate isomerase, class I [Dongshaea marina]|uniref:mannose-6-phosphate isomerase, class I n=1 Tax=Dongshaea marina TaxID=2047966 RepID=UPI001902C1A4|nr:mannose-6-phosphate isomerase, class I [Dongshaea marina]
MSVFAMRNPIQPYAWGSTDSIEKLFGIANPQQQPQAEVWMGAHPAAPSLLADGEGSELPLDQLIEQQAELYIGEDAQQRYGKRLPFLFKILAAAKPLSIQLHPTKAAAEAGFSAENARGVELSDSCRNYKDDNHKPELIYALTPFKAMHSFRPLSEMLEYLARLDAAKLPASYARLRELGDSESLKQFFADLMSLEGEAKQRALRNLMAVARGRDELAFRTVMELYQYYPGDIGLFSPLLLNVVEMQPGQALFVDAGVPHAYLQGTGLEIMANSDNVLRAGLTPKHMDVPELLANTRFEPVQPESLWVEPRVSGDESVFEVPVNDFSFSLHRLNGSLERQPSQAEILLCVEGELEVEADDQSQITLRQGESCFIGQPTQWYQIKGRELSPAHLTSYKGQAFIY